MYGDTKQIKDLRRLQGSPTPEDTPGWLAPAAVFLMAVAAWAGWVWLVW